jgi:hypothetical protein
MKNILLYGLIVLELVCISNIHGFASREVAKPDSNVVVEKVSTPQKSIRSIPDLLTIPR